MQKTDIPTPIDTAGRAPEGLPAKICSPLPCPFCGASKIRVADISRSNGWAWTTQWSVSCDHCCVDMLGPSQIETIQRWNRRSGANAADETRAEET